MDLEISICSQNRLTISLLPFKLMWFSLWPSGYGKLSERRLQKLTCEKACWFHEEEGSCAFQRNCAHDFLSLDPTLHEVHSLPWCIAWRFGNLHARLGAGWGSYLCVWCCSLKCPGRAAGGEDGYTTGENKKKPHPTTVRWTPWEQMEPQVSSSCSCPWWGALQEPGYSSHSSGSEVRDWRRFQGGQASRSLAHRRCVPGQGVWELLSGGCFTFLSKYREPRCGPLWTETCKKGIVGM